MPVVIHGPVEILHIWVMGSHDVVIKIRQKAGNGNLAVVLHVRMIWTEAHGTTNEMNSPSCSITGLLGILHVGPKITAVVVC